MSPVVVAAFNTVLAARAIYCVYQPIVDLDTVETVGFEALARGPSGTTWATPDALVSYAARVGRLPELDWICRAAACRGALAAGLPREMPLFVNVEPASSRTPCPPDLAKVIESGMDQLQVVIEVTERSVAADPAGLLAAVEQLRGQATRIALDDVGSDTASQAMMSLLRPDVIKLDRGIIQDPATQVSKSVIEAVRAESHRTGAVILAEGIETAEHVTRARAMGATLGQGWLFGRPGRLPRHAQAPRAHLPKLATPPLTAATPVEVARRSEPTRRAARHTLIRLSRELEDMGVHAVEPTVLLTTFQDIQHFDPATRRRYSHLADHGNLTAVFAEDMPIQPQPRIRGCPLTPDDPLIGEWNVIVIASQFAGGLFARHAPATAEGEPEFDLITTDDRDLILAAARILLQRLTPRLQPAA